MPKGLFVGMWWVMKGLFLFDLWALFTSNRRSKDHVTAPYPHTGVTLRRCSRSRPLGAHKIKTVLLDGAVSVGSGGDFVLICVVIFQILSQVIALWGGVLWHS
jgi:hypothetical protein